MNPLVLTLDISHERAVAYARNVVRGTKVQPALVFPAHVAVPSAYRRFQRLPEKAAFRQRLTSELIAAWAKRHSQQRAEALNAQFMSLVQTVDNDGALVVGDLILRERFADLVEQYDVIMASDGSSSLFHSYVNLRNHPAFLSSQTFCYAFMHPLFVAIMAYEMGGSIRLVDARAKDAEPLRARAQDNMLHIDNTPFNDEYKVIVTWERGTTRGPKGQNFVYLPGTQKGARNCFSTAGTAWSTENVSIFVTPESLDAVLRLQMRVRGASVPSVIEAHDPERPLSTVFAAGSLVHHRYRTCEGTSRSCLILAFHPAHDNPGGFFPEAPPSTDGLAALLMGPQARGAENDFLRHLADTTPVIEAALGQLTSSAGAHLVDVGERALSETSITAWKESVTADPEVEDIKRERLDSPFGRALMPQQVASVVARDLMLFDKHGPLDLILYEDNHEEKRKWARNRIREMPLDHIESRLEDWITGLETLASEDLMKPEALAALSANLREVAIRQAASALGPYFDERELISARDACLSVAQLLEDLSEAFDRCYSLQNYLSTSLFAFWCADEMVRLTRGSDTSIFSAGRKLLRHYLAAAIIEHQLACFQQAPR